MELNINLNLLLNDGINMHIYDTVQSVYGTMFVIHKICNQNL